MRVLGPPRPLRIAEWTQAQGWKILEAAWGNLAALISIEVAKKALEEVWETQLYAGMWPWETRSVVFYDALRLREAQWYVLFVSGSSFPPLPAHVVLVYWDCGTKLILPPSRLTRLHVVVCSHCDAVGGSLVGVAWSLV